MKAVNAKRIADRLALVKANSSPAFSPSETIGPSPNP